MTPVSAVLFDYGLVLTGPPDPTAWASMHHRLAADEPLFHSAYWRHRHDYDRGALNGDTYWQAVARDLSFELDPATLASLIDDDTTLWTQPNQPMIDWALDLQRRGIPTGILSNIGDAMETGVRTRCPWLAGFNHHTFSHSLGIAKPDTAIYTHAARGLNTAPHHILFIDDREENVAAARSIGMQTIHYTSHPAFEAEIQARQLDYLLTDPDRKSPFPPTSGPKTEHNGTTT